VLGTGVFVRRALVLAGVLAALLPAALMWGFTVDDALIPIRYAQNLSSGAGYRFDVHGPPSDGVTPLPWSFVLVILASADALTTLTRAKALGVLAWAVAAAVLGARLGTASKHLGKVFGGENEDGGGKQLGKVFGRSVPALAALVVVALAFEIGAWSASGLETGLVLALATLAATNVVERPRAAAILAGAAAAFRPELAPWAVTLAALGALERDRDARKAAIGAAIAVAPFVACAVARLIVFGRAAPLAVLAKPSDLSHGATYAGAATVVLLLPILALAPFAIARSRGTGAPTLAIAFCVHLASITAAGGDWMPYARLVVPVAPSLAIVFVETVARSHRASVAARVVVAVGLGALLAVRVAPAGRHVMADRSALVASARPMLADATAVAALDIGWVSASLPRDTRILDLAGLTDATIAVLPGGHTSKRVDAAMLLDRGIDVVVVWEAAPRVVEQRLLRSELFADRYERAATLPLGYAVYRRR
jgi:hypothetical protein